MSRPEACVRPRSRGATVGRSRSCERHGPQDRTVVDAVRHRGPSRGAAQRPAHHHRPAPPRRDRARPPVARRAADPEPRLVRQPRRSVSARVLGDAVLHPRAPQHHERDGARGSRRRGRQGRGVGPAAHAGRGAVEGRLPDRDDRQDALLAQAQAVRLRARPARRRQHRAGQRLRRVAPREARPDGDGRRQGAGHGLRRLGRAPQHPARGADALVLGRRPRHGLPHAPRPVDAVLPHPLLHRPAPAVRAAEVLLRPLHVPRSA